MKGKDFNSVKPYVYWIKNNITGIKYFGVRYRNIRLNKTPNQDFGKAYFTSGALKNDFKKNPDNFETKLIATFDTIEEAADFEKKQTKKIYKNKRYANIASYPAIIMTPEVRRNMSLAQQNMSEETRRRRSEAMSKARKGRKQSEEEKRKRRGRKRSEETRRRMSIAFKGRKISEEQKRQISKANKGRKHSEEARRRMSEFQKGRKKGPPSEEHRRNMSIAQKGRKHSEETRRRMSEFQKGRKKPPRSEEHRKKLSESKKGRKLSEEHRRNMSIAQKRRQERKTLSL